MRCFPEITAVADARPLTAQDTPTGSNLVLVMKLAELARLINVIDLSQMRLRICKVCLNNSYDAGFIMESEADIIVIFSGVQRLADLLFRI